MLTSSREYITSDGKHFLDHIQADYHEQNLKRGNNIMSFKNKQQHQQSKEEWIDVARISLWTKESKNGSTFLSGILELEDGRKMSVRIFKNSNPKSDKSPAFYGFGQCPESKEGDWVVGASESVEDDDDFGF